MRLCGREKAGSSTEESKIYDVWIEGPTGGMAVKGTVRTEPMPSRELSRGSQKSDPKVDETPSLKRIDGLESVVDHVADDVNVDRPSTNADESLSFRSIPGLGSIFGDEVNADKPSINHDEEISDSPPPILTHRQRRLERQAEQGREIPAYPPFVPTRREKRKQRAVHRKLLKGTPFPTAEKAVRRILAARGYAPPDSPLSTTPHA
jgi:hypothetical protein